MQGNPLETLKSTLPDLLTTDIALPNLWDSRFKVLIDNDAVLNRRLQDVEAGTRPSRNIQIAATLAALRSFPQPADGEVAYVPDYGLYRYYPAASEGENVPWTVRPDSGVGRWRIDMVPRRMLAVPQGIATLDSQGFVIQSVPNYSITAEKLAPGAVSTAAMGDMTLNDQTILNTNTGNVSQLLGAIGYRLKAITGELTWRTAPAVTLSQLNMYAARVDRSQTWYQKQTMTTLEVTGDFILPVR